MRARRFASSSGTRAVVSSTDALVLYLDGRAPGARMLVLGEAPLVGLLREVGYDVREDGAYAEVVVVSFDRTFDYRKLKGAFDAIRAGALLVGTNPDAYVPIRAEAFPTAGDPRCGRDGDGRTRGGGGRKAVA